MYAANNIIMENCISFERLKRKRMTIIVIAVSWHIRLTSIAFSVYVGRFIICDRGVFNLRSRFKSLKSFTSPGAMAASRENRQTINIGASRGSTIGSERKTGRQELEALFPPFKDQEPHRRDYVIIA